VLALLVFVALPGVGWAQGTGADPREVTDIARTLRCLVCENQSVAESQSQLAQEMRGYIQRRLEAGESRQQIVQALVERYGEGILLEPPRAGFTLLVWWLPVLSLGLGALVVALALRRWTRREDEPLAAPGVPDVAPEELAHYRARLAEELARRERGTP
jgi:cytochrome c-type biogenesis protein CcmH